MHALNFRPVNFLRLLVKFLLPIVCAVVVSKGAAAGRTPLLRYGWPEGQTNIYHLKVEVRDESGVEVLAGNVFVTAKSAATNIICLGLRCSLTPQRDASRSPYSPMGNQPRWLAVASISDCEIQFDDRGRVLRVSGDFPLPFPLGSLAQLFVEQLPASSDSRWETSDNVFVLDENLAFGPAAAFLNAQSYSAPFYGGNYNPRASSAVVAANRKAKLEAKTSLPEIVTIRKSVSVESILRGGTEPRLTATGDGELVFDRSGGFIRRAELDCKTVKNTESTTRRIATSLQLKLLEGTEREAVFRPRPEVAVKPARPEVDQLFNPQKPVVKKLTAEEIAKLSDDLKSDDNAARMDAVMKFQSSELAAVPPELLTTMSEMLTNSDPSLRAMAAKVICDYGTVDQMAIMIKLLKGGRDYSMRSYALKGLGRLKDKRAVEPLVALIAEGYEAYQVVDVLTKIGPDAEVASLSLLKEKHIDTRRQGCNILGRIGTKKSLEPLRELMLDTDYSLSSSAAEAVRSIQARLQL
jgi:hypothetical protein